MNDIPFEIISSIAKRAWKFSIIFLLYFFLSFFTFSSIVLYKKLYIINNLAKIDTNLYSFLSFLLNSSLVALFVYFLIWILKGENDITIKRLRNGFYQKAIDRVKEVVKNRFDLVGYNEDIKNLTEYTKLFEKNNEKHKVEMKNLKTYIVNGVDTLYFFYKINEKEKIIWSVWHSGDFLAIALAIEEKLVHFDNVESFIKKSFNLTSVKEYIFTKRDKYIWFDVKFDVSDEFLVNNIEKEKMTRWIAHFVSIGIIVGLEVLGWKKSEYFLVED